MIQVGVLPHQLINCTWRAFLFDLNVLSKEGENINRKKEIDEIIKKHKEKKEKNGGET